MPANFVRTPHDEHLWEKAKEIVRKEYGKTEDDGDEYWKLVVGVYKQAGGKALSDADMKRIRALKKARKKKEEKEKLQKSVETQQETQPQEITGDYIEDSLSMFRQVVADWWREKE